MYACPARHSRSCAVGRSCDDTSQAQPLVRRSKRSFCHFLLHQKPRRRHSCSRLCEILSLSTILTQSPGYHYTSSEPKIDFRHRRHNQSHVIIICFLEFLPASDRSQSLWEVIDMNCALPFNTLGYTKRVSASFLPPRSETLSMLLHACPTSSAALTPQKKPGRCDVVCSSINPA